MHLGRRLERERAFEMDERLVHSSFTRQNAAQAVMRGKGIFVERQRVFQMLFGGFRLAFIIYEQAEQEPRAEMIALIAERAMQISCGFDCFAEMEVVFANGET